MDGVTQLERVEFDMGSIRDAANFDLPGTLRALASAIDAGDLDGRFAAYAWRKGEAAEDIKQDLITATNKCKAEMIAQGERAV